jgi:hypothetical protein
MSLGRCKQQIQTLYDADKTVIFDYTRLTRSAWWDNKETCLQQFGGLSAVDAFLKGFTRADQWLGLDGVARPWSSSEISSIVWDSSDFVHNAPDLLDDSFVPGEQDNGIVWVTGNAVAIDSALAQWQTIFGQVQQESQSWWRDFTHDVPWFLHIGLWIIFWLFFIFSLSTLLKYFLAFIYDVYNAKRMVYFKVLLPRWDSKTDREREKELAKDMKEKISRMSQVYRWVHKLGHLSVLDSILRTIFRKPKITLLLTYTQGKLLYIIGTYPEYKKIVEGAIAAQYAEASLETIASPKIFSKSFHDIMPLETVKPPAYPIRTFKQLEDDPMNNLLDSIGKLPHEDDFTIMMTIKPEGNVFNVSAQKLANALYKKDESVIKGTKWRKKILPWYFLSFLVHGPSEKMIEKFTSTKKWWDPLVRMVKAEEDALNIMGEEAGKQAYESSLLLISCSDDQHRVRNNIQQVVSAFTVYKDEYNNELDHPKLRADVFGFLFKPMWNFGVAFSLTSFFFRKNIFTVNELASLFHLPDALYNRSPIISWMDYKVLAWPDVLPVLQDENGFIISGMLAEEYKWWVLSKILPEITHPAVGKREEIEERLIDLPADYKLKENEEIREVDGLQKLVQKNKKTIYGFKTYKDGVLLWVNIYRNRYTPVYMKRKDRTRHHYVIWKSGTGKSVYIDMLARQDIRSWDGVCVIDPHGDLVESILEYIPKERAKDVIYFDAWNEERPMGLNLYEISHPAEADRAVNDATEIFLKMFGPEIFGPRIQEYFKYGSLTLLEDMEDGATLIDVPRLFTDEWYRNYKVAKVTNPVVRNFWDKTYNAMWDREKQEIIPYFTSKFVSFITNSLIRNVIGQTKSAFNFREVMDDRKILLINLSKGKIGELNAQLLGMIMVSKIYNAAMWRANIAEKDRKDFYLYVDEFQNFVTNTFADILSEARKYKLALIMAHQYIAQLDWWGANNIGESWWWKKSVKDAVFGNVGTMQSFKVGAPDAEFLEKEYSPVLSAQDILWIANYKAYIKLNINNTTTRVFSMNAIYTTDYKNPKAAWILKQYCEKKYARKKEFVDAEIAARLWMLGIDDGEATLNSLQESTIPGLADSESWAWWSWAWWSWDSHQPADLPESNDG